jgi:CxxC motif-containing protein (DUF1111 family)
MPNFWKLCSGISVLLVSLSGIAQSQPSKARDPGPRPTDGSAGQILDGFPAGSPYINLFQAGLQQFEQVDTVSGDGLGPRMNSNSCASCHAQPHTGGSSPKPNPQFQFINQPDHGTNKLPAFITENGPTREVRFQKTSKGTADGGVHDLFTIAGMSGAPAGCNLTQPDFDGNKKNEIFRIPTPTFGGGLIEQITDQTIIDNLATEATTKQRLQIKGRVNIVVSGNTQTGQARIKGEVNTNGNDGTIARFGWKAQNKSLLIFSGEAYNVEMGITNELFQTEREEMCQNFPTPNDFTDPTKVGSFDLLSDIEKFAAFMRLLAPPTPSATVPGGAASITKGKVLFTQVGCNLCHTPTLMTDTHSQIPQLAGKPANLYSDLALHQMGDNLADGISQGQATGNEFRSAPLWGLGQRFFFLHDGRTSDLLEAIQEHRGKKSEATEVVKQFDRLSESDKQDLLNFLRSL